MTENLPADSKDLHENLQRALSGGRTNKVLRFLLGVLSSTPVFGGIFSATAGAWSEHDQSRVNIVVQQLLKITDDKVTELQGTLVDSQNQQHIVAGHISFNPNTAEFYTSSRISSLADSGMLDFTITFDRTFNNYIFTYYGSGPVALERVQETPDGMRIAFREPAPDRVTIVFFEEQPNSALNTDARREPRAG